jgi:hypothetical protein
MTIRTLYLYEYKCNRLIHGPIVSAILAARVALNPTPF